MEKDLELFRQKNVKYTCDGSQTAYLMIYTDYTVKKHPADGQTCPLPDDIHRRIDQVDYHDTILV